MMPTLMGTSTPRSSAAAVAFSTSSLETRGVSSSRGASQELRRTEVLEEERVSFRGGREEEEGAVVEGGAVVEAVEGAELRGRLSPTPKGDLLE